MDASSSACRTPRWLVGVVSVVSAAAVVLALFQTRTEWFKTMDTKGEWHKLVWESTAVLLPLAVLLFAFGVQWALRRRPSLAVPALLPLPAWIACLLLVDSLLANDCWWAIIGMQLQGIQPFGVR